MNVACSAAGHHDGKLPVVTDQSRALSGVDLSPSTPPALTVFNTQMPPQSRGSRFRSFSKSTPNLRNAISLEALPTVPEPLHTYTDLPQTHQNAPLKTSTPPNSTSAATEDDTRSRTLSISDDLFGLNRSTSDSETDSFDDTTPSVSTQRPQRPMYSQSSRSQSYLGPPFYNRPPTPLPPSPSLTSLLRPPFSTHTSRPASPESSDTEASAAFGVGTSRTVTAADTVAASARAATTVPRASPKVPTYEYYGFVLYLGSSAAFAFYLLWSYLPTPFLHRLGIYYYPDRWWSLAVPSWIVMGLVYIYVALACYNTGYMTLPLGSIENLVDSAADVAIVDATGMIVRRGKRGVDGVEASQHEWGSGRTNQQRGEEPRELDWKTLWNTGTDAVLDIPIGGVCEVLYGSGQGLDDDL